MKILITGGGGFVGSHLSDAFLERGDEVFILDTGSMSKVRHLLGHPRFRIVRDSVMSLDILDSLIAQVDLVYHLAAVVGVEHYEERMLAMLLQLHTPQIHVVFCSSATISEEIVEYYLSLIPGVPMSHSRPRLTMVSCDDLSPRPLTEKLLERPGCLRRIHDELARSKAGAIVCMNTTDIERKLAVELGIPLLGNPPDLDHLGSKSGSRETFREAGIDLPAG